MFFLANANAIAKKSKKKKKKKVAVAEQTSQFLLPLSQHFISGIKFNLENKLFFRRRSSLPYFDLASALPLPRSFVIVVDFIVVAGAFTACDHHHDVADAKNNNKDDDDVLFIFLRQTGRLIRVEASLTGQLSHFAFCPCNPDRWLQWNPFGEDQINSKQPLSFFRNNIGNCKKYLLCTFLSPPELTYPNS